MIFLHTGPYIRGRGLHGRCCRNRAQPIDVNKRREQSRRYLTNRQDSGVPIGFERRADGAFRLASRHHIEYGINGMDDDRLPRL